MQSKVQNGIRQRVINRQEPFFVCCGSLSIHSNYVSVIKYRYTARFKNKNTYCYQLFNSLQYKKVMPNNQPTS